MSLRTRIDRLARRRETSRSWIEQAGENEDGMAIEAHVFEHPDGRRVALVVPVAVDAEKWARAAACFEANRRERQARAEVDLRCTP